MSREGVWASVKSTFETISSSKFHPSNPLQLEPGQEVTTALSVSDANKTGWGQAACVWFYKAPNVGTASFLDQNTLKHLQTSLSKTLDAYRPWCGRLRAKPYYREPQTQSISHYGRLELVNGDDDPGVLFIVAKCNGALESLVPSPEERRSKHVRWNAFGLDHMDWFSETPVANPLGKPGTRSDEDHVVIVKVTLLDCGSAAIAIKISHACADAHSVARFAQDWSAVSRALLAGTTLPHLSPLFASDLVDATAGNIDAKKPDLGRTGQAKSLPCHRFDSWTSLPDQVPHEFEHDPAAKMPTGDQMPLLEMGMASQKSHYVLHYRCDQIQHLWKAASEAPAVQVSRQDALLAHIWSRINAARGLQQDQGPVYCNYMLGFRSRMRPPLGDTFVGAPFAVVAAQGTARDVCSPDRLSSTASLINSTTRRFNAATIGLLMHLWAYESSPMRVWGHMFGKRHLMVTSWVREGVNTVDFGFGSPYMTRMNLPSIDGMLQLVEAPRATPTDTATEDRDGLRWERYGVEASICLAEEVMKPLLEDPLLLP